MPKPSEKEIREAREKVVQDAIDSGKWTAVEYSGQADAATVRLLVTTLIKANVTRFEFDTSRLGRIMFRVWKPIKREAS